MHITAPPFVSVASDETTKHNRSLMYGLRLEERRSCCPPTATTCFGNLRVSLMAAHERPGGWIDSSSKKDGIGVPVSIPVTTDPIVLIVHVETDENRCDSCREPCHVEEPHCCHSAASELAPPAPQLAKTRKLKIYASECQRLPNGGHHYSAASLRKRLAQHQGSESTDSVDTRPYDVVSSKSKRVIALPTATENILELFGSRLQLKSTSRCRPSHSSVPRIKGRHFDFHGSLSLGGRSLKFVEQTNRQNHGTSYNVWDGALLLARYLQYATDIVKGLRVLELGAGCGVAGLAAAALGASYVTLTDLPGEVLEHLQTNIGANDDLLVGSRVEARACDWRDPPADLVAMRKYDIILVADCIWVEELVGPLFDVLDLLTRPAASADVPPVEETTESTTTLPQGNQDETFTSIQEIGKRTRDERSSGTLDDSTHDRFERGNLERNDAVCQSSFYLEDFDDCASFYEDDVKTTTVLISYQRRGKSTHEAFMRRLNALFTEIEIVQVPNQPQIFTIFSCQR